MLVIKTRQSPRLKPGIPVFASIDIRSGIATPQLLACC